MELILGNEKKMRPSKEIKVDPCSTRHQNSAAHSTFFNHCDRPYRTTYTIYSLLFVMYQEKNQMAFP
ncbi:hypothetical protein VTJ04DRAFT_6308 [Mycothermus thermophilus]|uniref:uncharacterized protein n=1 Tax=Humicola insolens TaxID=85995 RepID=UPI003743E7EE